MENANRLDKPRNEKKKSNINIQSLTLYLGAIGIFIVFTAMCKIMGKSFFTPLDL